MIDFLAIADLCNNAVKMNQKILDEVSTALNEGAVNYSVFLHLYQMSTMQNEGALGYIREALGADAVVGGIEDVPVDVVCSEVEESLLFAGDEGAGPSGSVLNSTGFRNLIVGVGRGISELVGNSRRIKRFWLREGHPAYPVFWDFAFLFLGEESVSIIVGSSSD
ncbi:hypothetical protein [Ralstonia pseudosolanacearum]|uniref:Uncharacterized protein n=1 Tax=Ralstonia solanacearum TaxID=305 RepID=A0AA92IG12_RALSL|nr:hypothetical protein [Ralstonia pseudosolanacearum]QCX51632.1 hypothetical protein E7Z57_21650 [Ralstonia pseudosolanacearum]